MTPVRVVPLVLSAVGLLASQTVSPYEEEVRRARDRLRSASLVEKAWGAYYAGRLRSDLLNQELIAQLRTESAFSLSEATDEKFAFVSVLLDALIETQVQVPSKLLEPYLDKWTDAVMILLSRSPDSESLLMRFRPERPHVLWLAANNSRAGSRTPGMTAFCAKSSSLMDSW